ncbi:MAG: RnfABCDGE type electron transport complex subunit D [Desulfobacteraceae bacterium]|nr:RnfABCDGE type electron transport complex subunit D [Desulfobacteraceae bacterium]
MPNRMKLTVSHAPFWHDGSSITSKQYNIIAATLIAVIAGLIQYGIPALAALTLSVGSAMAWEFIMNLIMRRPVSIGDGNAALIGLLLGMLLPAATPWWVVITGTLVAVVIGKQIYGGIGGNPFNPVVVAYAIILVSWPLYLDFNAALVDFSFDFPAAYPLVLYKSYGTGALESFTMADLLLGNQAGGIGATFGLGLIIGGIYLILRGFIRWEIPVAFLAGMFITALAFSLYNPEIYAGPGFHILTGYTLIGAFFLAPEDSSSPVHFIPMLIYGALGGFLTVMIRNLGAHVDGVIYAILIMNLVHPLIDKIRPKAMGRVMHHA